MRQEIRSKLKERRDLDLENQLSRAIDDIESEGYSVEFGEIGTKTTYALLTRNDEEIVGYTFIKNVQYKNENIGKYKALQQALTRKSILEQQEDGKGDK